MEALELETVLLVAGLVLTGVAVPVAVIAVHQRRRRARERAAAVRRKEKISL